MEVLAIQGHRKESSGKEGAKKIRRNGQVPAIIYKSGGGDAIQLALVVSELRNLIYTPKFKMAEISLNGAKHKCILKDIQFHPVTDEVIHLDFLELVPGVKFNAEVSLRFIGTAPGVKAGGKFLPTLRAIKITTTPENAIDEVHADISTMDLGTTIRVRDINPVAGVEINNSPAVPIATIEIPRALRGGK